MKITINLRTQTATADIDASEIPAILHALVENGLGDILKALLGAATLPVKAVKKLKK